MFYYEIQETFWKTSSHFIVVSKWTNDFDSIFLCI